MADPSQASKTKGALWAPFFIILFLTALWACESREDNNKDYIYEDGYTWEVEPSYPSLPITYQEVPRQELIDRCKSHNRSACAHRRYDINQCIIFTEKKPPEWILKHERKHCRGFEHLEAT